MSSIAGEEESDSEQSSDSNDSVESDEFWVKSPSRDAKRRSIDAGQSSSVDKRKGNTKAMQSETQTSEKPTKPEVLAGGGRRKSFLDRFKHRGSTAEGGDAEKSSSSSRRGSFNNNDTGSLKDHGKSGLPAPSLKVTSLSQSQSQDRVGTKPLPPRPPREDRQLLCPVPSPSKLPLPTSSGPASKIPTPTSSSHVDKAHQGATPETLTSKQLTKQRSSMTDPVDVVSKKSQVFHSLLLGDWKSELAENWDELLKNAGEWSTCAVLIVSNNFQMTFSDYKSMTFRDYKSKDFYLSGAYLGRW
jgi:hypothetical protein